MVELKKESDSQTASFSLLCYMLRIEHNIRFCIAHPGWWNYKLSSLPNTVSHCSKSRRFPDQPVNLLVHVLKCNRVALGTLRVDILA